ncbi:MAG TPA: tetratricopeptide repeat protein, partial [Stellaceae bacterium]|nr:tetratricopeptide repeat protein [Stellaceae bacterium]
MKRALITRLAAGLALAGGLAAAQPCAAAEQDTAAALAAAEARDGIASPKLLPVIERLAAERLTEGALGEAAVLRRRGLTIAIAAYGCDSPRAAGAMAALAMLDIDRRHYLDAEPLLIVAAQVFETAGDGAALAETDAGLARIALARGRVRGAETWARHAVDLATRNPGKNGDEALRALGAVLTSDKRFEEAERVLTEALAQARGKPDEPRALSLLGNLELRRDRPERALRWLEQAAALDRGQLGPTHPFIADDLYDVGLAYEALQRDADARRMFDAAIAVLERGAGRDTSRVAYAEIELSRVYRRAGDKQAADA